MIELTNFGFIYLFICSYILLFHTEKIPGLLIFSTVVQAASVFNISLPGFYYGISPYNFTALLIIIIMVREFSKKTNFLAGPTNMPLVFLSGYILVAFVGSFALPNIFSDTYVVRHDEVSGFDGQFKAVKWNLLNLVQAVNLIINFLILCYFIKLVKNNTNLKLCAMQGLLIGFLLIFAIGIYERLVLIFQFYSLIDFWSSNPSYAQHGIADGGLVKRIGIPFSEPSYNSAFIAAFATSSLSLVLWGKRIKLGFLLLLISIFLTINAMGVTGIIATVIIYPVMIFIYFFRLIYLKDFRENLPQRLFLLISVFAFIGAFLYFSDSYYSEIAKKLFYQPIEKISWQYLDSKWTRLKIDLNSLTLIIDTYGLGVGLGSLRASSFLVTLLVSTGVLGLLLWILFLFTLIIKYIDANTLTDGQLIAVFGLIGCSSSMFIGIPDLNLPMYWGFIFLGFVFCPGNEADDKEAGDGCPPARA